MDSRRGRGKERVFGGRNVDSISASSSRTDNNEVLVEDYANAREGFHSLRPEQSGTSRETYTRLSQFPIDNWMPRNGLEMHTGRSISVNSSVGDSSAHLKNFAGSLRSRESMDQWSLERGRFEGSYGSPGFVAERGRIPTSAYPDDGPSRYNTFDGHGEEKYRGDLAEVEDLEQDRAVLLRKLDELKEQLANKSYNGADRPREVVPVERSRTPPDPYGDQRSRTPPDPYGDQLTYNLSVQPYAVEQQMPRPPLFNYSNGPMPSMDHYSMDMQNFYPPQRHPLNVIPEYEDPSRPQLQRRPPHHSLQSPRPPPHEYFMGQQKDFNLNPLASYPHENGYQFHAPACSCLACYNHNWGIPTQAASADFGDRRVPNAPMNLNSYHHVNPATFVPYNNNPQYANPPPLHRRWQSDLDSDNDGYGDTNPRRAMPVNRRVQIFHPIAGGAPFFTCFSCFQLLKLPRKLRKTNLAKLRCGSCSTVIYLQLKNKKLVTSVLKDSITSVPKDSITSVTKDSNSLSSEVDQSEVFKVSPRAGDTNSLCDDADNSERNLQFIDTKENSLAEDQRLNLDEYAKRQSLPSSSSISSKEDDEISDSLFASIHISDSTEVPMKKSFSPAPPGSPLWQQSDSPSKHGVNRDGKGNKSEETDQEKAFFGKNTSRQNSVNERSVEAEVDDSFNDYLNTSISQDSAEKSKEEDQHKVGKGADSFLMGLIKKSFRDLSKSSQDVGRTRPNVSINGQPLPDSAVKKAEKLAGPIQPGDYWYDFRAGFWGVMGQTCLGIIPPFIEEFYYPMPTNCAAGNTGVYVNGRELHQRDLDLLASRGLPTTSEKFYIVEISGRVVDEDSGEVLDSLGKLAPTIEKVKHGFGMKVPRRMAV